MIVNSIIDLIGNTPLLLIPENIHQIRGVEIYANLEYMNPFGSIKDRTALSIFQKTEGKDIIESSSGNTAKALGAIASIHEKKLLTVTNRIKQDEVENILRVLGVEIESLPPGSECPDPNDPNSPFATIERIMSREPGKYIWTDQYTNQENPRIHHDTTAKEIHDDIGIPDYLFSGLGTTGSSRGISEYFHEQGADLKTIGIITKQGSYIPGIRSSQEMHEVGLFEKKYYADFLSVDEQSAIDALITLTRKCGMHAGPTTGAIFSGMRTYLSSLAPEDIVGKKAVFIACDRFEPYMSYLRERRPEIFAQKTKTTKKIIPAEAKSISWQDMENRGFLVIDMRSYPSYLLEHIPGSISFPFHRLQTYLQEGYLPFPQETPLVFVCPYGEESELACQIANGLGYKSYSLIGGMEGKL